jgi:hypothetical protein
MGEPHHASDPLMSTNRSDFTTWVDEAIRAEFEAQGYWTSATWLDLFLASFDR